MNILDFFFNKKKIFPSKFEFTTGKKNFIENERHPRSYKCSITLKKNKTKKKKNESIYLKIFDFFTPVFVLFKIK